MHLLVNIVLFVVYSLYSGLTQLILSGLKKKPELADQTEDSYSVSILIAARNEERNISNTLDSIINSDFPKLNYEIIVVNDHSEDLTEKVVRNWSATHSESDISIYLNDGKGKKEAVRTGVLAAKYDVVLQTDADCAVSKNWIKAMTIPFANRNVNLVAGPVFFVKKKSFWNKIQYIEFLSLIASSIGLSRMGWHVMANAANLAFRKEVWLGISKDEKSKSGDDVFLLQRIAKQNENAICYLSENNSVVYTNGSRSIKEFIDQRVRWASKSGEYPSKKAKWVGILVFLVSLAQLYIYGLWISASGNALHLVLFFSKFVFDYWLLSRFSKEQGIALSPLAVFFLFLIYPFYFVYVGVLSLFYKPKWKGRSL